MSSWASKSVIKRKIIRSIPPINDNISKNDVYYTKDTIITLIIVLNNSILNTLQSLLNQTDYNWLALIINTTINIPNDINDILKSDNRFKIIDCTFEKDKSIEYYENYGASFVYTDWLMYVNSGIKIVSNSIEILRNIILSNNIDCIFYKTTINNYKYTTFCYKTILFYDNYKMEENIFKKLELLKHKTIYNNLYI